MSVSARATKEPKNADMTPNMAKPWRKLSPKTGANFITEGSIMLMEMRMMA